MFANMCRYIGCKSELTYNYILHITTYVGKQNLAGKLTLLRGVNHNMILTQMIMETVMGPKLRN